MLDFYFVSFLSMLEAILDYVSLEIKHFMLVDGDMYK